MRDAVVTCALLAAVTIFAQPCQAQIPNDPDEARIEDLITASHMLANEGILDSFGHATVRSVTDPSHFFMPRAMPPALVSRADIVELDFDCKPVTPNAPRLNGERYIHCEIYKARSDVQSVIHTHDLAVIPFGLTEYAAAAGARSSRLLAEGDPAVRGSRRLWSGGDRARHAGAQFRARKGAGDQAREQSCGSDARSRRDGRRPFRQGSHGAHPLHQHRCAGAERRDGAEPQHHGFERCGIGDQRRREFRRRPAMAEL